VLLLDNLWRLLALPLVDLVLARWLAVVRPRMNVALPVVELQGFRTVWMTSQVKEAIAVVITIWLAIPCAAEPTRGTIRCLPSCLLRS